MHTTTLRAAVLAAFALGLPMAAAQAPSATAPTSQAAPVFDPAWGQYTSLIGAHARAGILEVRWYWAVPGQELVQEYVTPKSKTLSLREVIRLGATPGSLVLTSEGLFKKPQWLGTVQPDGRVLFMPTGRATGPFLAGRAHDGAWELTPVELEDGRVVAERPAAQDRRFMPIHPAGGAAAHVASAYARTAPAPAAQPAASSPSPAGPSAPAPGLQPPSGTATQAIHAAGSLETNYAKLCSSGERNETCDALRDALGSKRASAKQSSNPRDGRLSGTSNDGASIDSGWGAYAALDGTYWRHGAYGLRYFWDVPGKVLVMEQATKLDATATRLSLQPDGTIRVEAPGSPPASMHAESDGLYVQPYAGALASQMRSTTRISRDALVHGLQILRDGAWQDHPSAATYLPISREEFTALAAEGERFRAAATNPAVIQQRWGVFGQLPGHTWVSEEIGFSGLAALGGGYKFPEYRRYDWNAPGLSMKVTTRLPSALDENIASTPIPIMLDPQTGAPAGYTIDASGAAVMRFVDAAGNGSETRLQPTGNGQFEEQFFTIENGKAKLLTRKRFLRSDVLAAQKRERADRWSRIATGLGVAATMAGAASSGDTSAGTLSTIATGLQAMTTDDPEAKRAFLDKMDQRTAELKASAEYYEAQINARADEARRQMAQQGQAQASGAAAVRQPIHASPMQPSAPAPSPTPYRALSGNGTGSWETAGGRSSSPSAGEASTRDHASSCVGPPVTSTHRCASMSGYKGMVSNSCSVPVDVRMCFMTANGWNCQARYGLGPQQTWEPGWCHANSGQVFHSVRYSDSREPLASP